MDATAVGQDEVDLLILLARPQEHVVRRRPADAERALTGIVRAVGSRHIDRQDVGKPQVGFRAQEQAGGTVDGVAALRAATRRRPLVGRCVAAVEHRSGEAVDPSARVGDDLAPVGGYVAMPVDVPALAPRRVAPELDALPGWLVTVVGVDHPGAVRKHDGASGLHGEVDRRLDADHRQRERRLVDRNRRQAERAHDPSRGVADAGASRQVQLQAWNARRADDRRARRLRRDANLIPYIQTAHPNRVRKDGGPVGTQVDARFKAAIAPAGAAGRRTVNDEHLVPGRDAGQAERAFGIGAGAVTRQLEPDVSQRPAVEAPDPPRQRGPPLTCSGCCRGRRHAADRHVGMRGPRSP